jgi:hypothetical protein
LDLETPDQKQGAVITLKFKSIDSSKIGRIAVRSAIEDIKLRGVGSTTNAPKVVRGMEQAENAEWSKVLKSLGGVLSKLDLFVAIVDKAVTVIVKAFSQYFITE